MSLVSTSLAADSVIRLSLERREKKNALSIALRDAVAGALDALRDDASVKVVVLTGGEGIFSAGFDLGEFQKCADPEFAKTLWASSDRYHRTLLEFPLPTIAAVDGAALGGGFDTAVLCDLRVISSRARFGHPEAAFSDVVYTPLHDLVGGAIARDLCLTGRTIDADEAVRLGLASRVVAPEDLDRVAIETASLVARAPREVLLRTKAKIVARAGIAFRETLAL